MLDGDFSPAQADQIPLGVVGAYAGLGAWEPEPARFVVLNHLERSTAWGAGTGTGTSERLEEPALA